MLPLWVSPTDCPVSADAWIAAASLAEWVHVQPVADTALMLEMFLGSLAVERERYTAALFAHDRAAADEAAAEQRDLVAMAAVCQDHLRSVGVL